jgi:hypothetical protein
MAADMGQEEHDRDAVARGRALTALVRPYLPLDVLVHGPADAWPLVGPALIARATGSLEAILALVPLTREADADTLLRSLYEHVTTFAWLAAEPGEERMRRWLKSDCEARLRTDDDCRKVGVKILDDDRRKELEDTVAALPKGMPVLLDRAEAADAHWASRVAGLRDSTTPTSFRGLNAAAYRVGERPEGLSDRALFAGRVDLGLVAGAAVAAFAQAARAAARMARDDPLGAVARVGWHPHNI